MAARSPQFTIGSRTLEIDVPHLAFATAIAGWCVWFCQDAWRAQKDVENLIMIVPASVLAIVLYIVVAVGCVHIVPVTDAHSTAPRRTLAPGLAGKIAGTMALLGGYAVCAPWIGFDVMSFLFLLAMLLLLGERRPVVLLLVPLLFCAAMIWCFNTLLQTSLPLLLFPGDAP